MISKNTLALTLGAITGCAATPVQPAGQPAAPVADASKPQPASAAASVDANLERLRGLSVVTVGQLVVDAPDGAYSCYGPCPRFAGELEAARVKSAERLQRLVEAAAAAPADTSPATCSREVVDANLAALKDLRIVDVQGFYMDSQQGPSCYAGQCPDEEAAWAAKWCEKAGKLAGIAAAAKNL